METCNQRSPDISIVLRTDNPDTKANAVNDTPRRSRKPKKTIANARLKAAQHLHALVVSSVSLMGLVVALTLLILGNPIGLVEIGLFVGCTFVIGIGTSVGFHRYFTHRSFKATMPVRVILAILGSMAAQGPLIFWVALHRLHHEHSDQPSDPHSPHFHGSGFLGLLRGLWHAHIGWTFKHEVPNATYYANELIKDKVISKINQMYFIWVFLGLLIPSILGGVLTRTWMGVFYGFLWGGLVRMFFWHNMVWCITSLAHVFGHRPLDSHDQSTNNFWLAIPTLGESWHNNHHAFPHSAITGFEWWQFDLSGWIIRALEGSGLAWDVKVPTKSMIKTKTIA
ncbi:MAG: acyl-CoA desaturase [Moorea sp. SIO3I7]|nr:acyl-CoA desaturase [Moorena sp. SIO3I7]NEO43443.1 acyl-CoA desaturase [Moorena sp. SIO4A3]